MKTTSLLRAIAENFNLSTNATKVYIHCFMRGSKSVSKLPKELRLDKSSAYLAVSQLESSGLVYVDDSIRPKTVHVYEPTKVLGLIEQKIAQHEHMFEQVDRHRGRLNNLVGHESPGPMTEKFTGTQATEKLLQLLVDSRTRKICIYTNPETETIIFDPNKHEEFIATRVRSNVYARVLACDSSKARKLQSTDASHKRHTKLIGGDAPFKSELYLFPECAALIDNYQGENAVLFIHSQELVKLLQWQFDMIWEAL